MKTKVVLAAALMMMSIAACQQAGSGSGSPSGNQSDTAKSYGPLGPVDDPSQVNIPAGSGYLSNPQELIRGTWVTQCLSQNIQPHYPYIGRLSHYRMFYFFDAQNGAVAHVVRDYQDPLCRDTFGGPLSPNTNDSLVIKGFYQVTNVLPMNGEMIEIQFTFRNCSGQACMPKQNPQHGIYISAQNVAAFQATDDRRQVLFWGSNFQFGPGAVMPGPAPTPYGAGGWGAPGRAGNFTTLNADIPFFRASAPGDSSAMTY